MKADRQSARKTTEPPGAPTLTEQAYRILRYAILRGDLREGAFLSEAEITAKYGISRTPFREACSRLHYEELLEVVPRRGYLVAKIGFSYVRDLFELRQHIEGIVAELAAARAEDSQIEELASLIQDSSRRVQSKNGREVDVLINANTEFHLALARMTQNAELLKVVRMILERSEHIAFIEYRCTRFQWTDLGKSHWPIVEALRKRDAVAVRKAVLNDITEAQISTLSHSSRHRARPISDSGS